MPRQFSKMAAGCRPGFDRTGNSAIRSASPENPTLEPNIKWIGSPVTEIWPFEIPHITRGAFGTPILRKEEVVGVIDGGSLYASHCDHCNISDQTTAAICHRMSATLNSTGSLWVKILGCYISIRSVMWVNRLRTANTPR